MWDSIYNIINYPLIEEEGFIFSPLNILVFIGIWVVAKVFIKYLKRYFNLIDFSDKQLKIDGKEIAIWKLIKQIIYFVVLFLCIVSLLINNDQIDSSQILEYEFFRIKEFHVAVYHIFYVVIVYFVARFSIGLFQLYISRTIRKKKGIDQGTEYIYVQFAKYIVYTVMAIVMIRGFGIDLNLLLAGLTAMLVGLAIGLQSIFSDYFSGLLLLFEGNIKVGDIIEVDYLSGREELIAKVNEINLRSTKIETPDGKVIIVPNSKLTQDGVNNWNLDKKLTRYKIKVSVAYGSDTELVTKILISCAEAHPIVDKKQKPNVRLLNFGDNGLEMDLLFWARQNLNIDTHKSEIRFAIDKAFRENNIVIPFPQRDLYLKQMPAK